MNRDLLRVRSSAANTYVEMSQETTTLAQYQYGDTTSLRISTLKHVLCDNNNLGS